MKLIGFYKASLVHDPKEFQQWFLQEQAPRMLASARAPRRCTVNLVEPTPQDIPYRPTSELPTEDGEPAYDVVVEAWCDDARAHALPAADALMDAGWVTQTHIYRVEEFVERDLLTDAQRAPLPGGRSQGLKYMSRLQMHADLGDVAGQRSWAWHAGLALKVHVGAAKYVRNWITQALTPDLLCSRGVVQLHFPTREALLQRFFDSERGRDEILHDVGHFVSSANRLYVGEYILRRGGA